MKKSNYKVLGVMSGTSLDGIDIACINFIPGKKWDFSITAAQTFQYSISWQKKLSKLYFDVSSNEKPQCTPKK